MRGTVSNELYRQAVRAFARVTGAAPEAVEAKVLYAPVPAALALLVLDGDGDPDRPIYRGTVADLLATF